ncbi:MAG: hypothetical protein UHN88_03185 [Eubacterium sp.]|nr:hypothetical protein [Eubacterium sp.]
MPWWVVLIIIAAITAAVFLALYFIGKRTQKKQDEQQAQMEAAKQTISMLVIDKKKLKLKDAGFPDYVLAQVPKLSRIPKFPIVKAKVGPKIMTFIADKKVYEMIPVKKEVKATVSGLYITDVKGVRGPIVAPKKKKSKLEELLKKGRGEA